jgi:ectoine hydroxylase-related dioxygenase (phytanoyl-CoA dioxygenase family)
MTLGLFLQPDAADRIAALPIPADVKHHALEVVQLGYTVIRRAVPSELCEKAIDDFRRLEAANESIFAENRNSAGHYPRIVNLHGVLPALMPLFTRNPTWLAVQDALFGAPTALYTSLFYEVGSQQPLHRDTPVFATRPEYLYFGTTVYLERADDENGCLQVMERGHTIGELDRETMARKHYGWFKRIPDTDNDLWVKYQGAVVDEGQRLGLPIKAIHVEAGDSLIWHPQLPHGGSAIRDPRRTRFSLVMHTTPVGVPVYHHPAFFQPRKRFSQQAAWQYYEVEGRSVADFRTVISFGHERRYPVPQFRLA